MEAGWEEEPADFPDPDDAVTLVLPPALDAFDASEISILLLDLRRC